MPNAKGLIYIGITAIGTAILEKICISLNKSDFADFIRVAAISTCAGYSFTITIKLINQMGKYL